MNLDKSIPLTKINSKWIKDVNMRPKCVKLLTESTRKNPLTLVLAMSNEFLDMMSEALATKPEMNH